MTKRSFAPLSKFLGILVAGLGPTVFAGAALAAPTITVSKVSNTGTQMTLKVTGSGFTRSKTHQIEIDSNFAYSGSDIQTVSVNADSGGRISTQFTRYLNASCAIGVVATDLVTRVDSNSKDLSYGSPCLPPSFTSVHLLGSSGSLNAAVEFTVSHFTPLGSISVTLTDLQTGQVNSSDFSAGASGSFTTHSGFPWPSSCGHTVRLEAIDDFTDTLSTNSPTIVLCK
jgi:hypothetical protein